MSLKETQRWHQQRNQSCSIADSLPIHLLIDILSRLPFKSIFTCRCVSKLWLRLLSDPLLSQAPLSLLLQPTNDYQRYRREPDPNCRTLQLFDLRGTLTHSVDSRLTLRPNTNLPDVDFGFVNSCNGLLCLYDRKSYDPIYVCNPILGHYITLPMAQGKSARVVGHGFGFACQNKQYKVIRIVRTGFGHGGLRHRNPNIKRMAEIYTLGEGTWRSLGNAQLLPSHLNFNTYLNGVLHWNGYEDLQYISFNFDTEQFAAVPGPEPDLILKSHARRSCLGVLRHCLSVSYFDRRSQIEIWVMKEYGVRESWSKDFVIEFTEEFMHECLSLGLRYVMPCEPIMVMESGDILILVCMRALVLFDPIMKRFRYLGLYAVEGSFRAVAYTPTCVSLMDFAREEDVKACRG